MPRNALSVAQPVGPDFIGATPPDMAAQEYSARQHLASVEANFDIAVDYNLALFIAIARNDAQQADMYLVRLGFVLSQIHGKESADDYRDAVEQIGISLRYADKLRAAALRLNDKKPILALGRTKALELLSEDDETLAALADDSVALDRYARMTTRELREEIRAKDKERADEKAADEEIIRNKDERINKLMRSKRKLETSGVRAQVDELLRDMDECAVVLAQQATLLVRGINDVRRAYDDAGEHVDPDVEARITQNVALGAQWLHELAAADGE